MTGLRSEQVNFSTSPLLKSRRIEGLETRYICRDLGPPVSVELMRFKSVGHKVSMLSRLGALSDASSDVELVLWRLLELKNNTVDTGTGNLKEHSNP
ncbi:hypothetical protein TNCV_1533421 [Trichonephila clavipes]|nr:hypothetical protein TNCV_1533421 [Trichonephila clavipes]